MPYVVQTAHNPAKAGVQAATLKQHLDYLVANKSKLLAAGALLDDRGSPCGGLLILDVEDRESADEFMSNDPFTKAGVSATITMKPWRKAFFNFERCV